MSKRFSKTILAATVFGLAAFDATAALAQAAPASWGSAAFLTARNCNGLAGNVDCLGAANPDIRIKQSLYDGGAGVSTNATLSPPAGGLAVSNITYGAFDLPIIKAGAWAGADNRVNSNSIGYQSFAYSGPAATPFSLTANFDFTSSGAAQYLAGQAINPNAPNEFGGEGFGFLRVQIFDSALFPSLTTAQDIFNFGFTSACGDPGVIGEASVSLASLAAGAGSGALTLDRTCGGGALTLAPSSNFVVAMLLQTPTNRSGFFDATHTVTLGLSDTIAPEVRQTLERSLVSALSAVPETSTWTMLIAGFGLIGASLRRKRALAAA